MDGNMAKLLITIATLKKENERLNKILDEKGGKNETNISRSDGTNSRNNDQT